MPMTPAPTIKYQISRNMKNVMMYVLLGTTSSIVFLKLQPAVFRFLGFLAIFAWILELVYGNP